MNICCSSWIDTEINGPVLIFNDTLWRTEAARWREHTPFSIGDSYLTELAT